MTRRTDKMRPVGLAVLCAASLAFGPAAADETAPAGAAMLRRAVPVGEVFSQPLTGMDAAARMEFVLGKAMFDKLWVASPSSTKASDGLGPLYNARSCALCHPGNGRALAPAGDGPLTMGLVLRLSVPAEAQTGIEGYLATLPDPAYGAQLQTDAVSGLAPEAAPSVRYEARASDGVELRVPEYDPGVALSAATMISPRLAPPVMGMGLIAAIPEADIRAGADPEDADGDGISGRINLVPSEAGPQLGRFGWKAGMASLPAQVADAFSHDIGISSPLLPEGWGDCTEAQTACRAAPHGDGDVRGTEIDAEALALTTAYVAGLTLPARPDPAATAEGRDLFAQVGCAACHRVEWQLPGPIGAIRPHSDFLLHDMGDGLADNRPEHRATGREWRTPPLWGIGRTTQVSGGAFFLHDGRARSLSEAIHWHGGEGQNARDRFVMLSHRDRDALLAYLESL